MGLVDGVVGAQRTFDAASKLARTAKTMEAKIQLSREHAVLGNYAESVAKHAELVRTCDLRAAAERVSMVPLGAGVEPLPHSLFR